MCHYLLFAAQSNGSVEATVDGGSTWRPTDATDDESSSCRRQKHSRQRVDVSIPPSPRKPTNPYSLYSMLRKKVRFVFLSLFVTLTFKSPVSFIRLHFEAFSAVQA